MRWIRQYSTKYNKPTSLWHLFHSLRASKIEGYALSQCGYTFYNTKMTNDMPKKDMICNQCWMLYVILTTTEEIPDDLVSMEFVRIRRG